MENDPHKLKLGKGSRFVKAHLRRLPQGIDAWEADFRPDLRNERDVWQGLVVTHDGGLELAERMLERPPTANDMADLLADAMLHPTDENPRRPLKLRIRKRREWEDLLPHLRQIGIVTISAPRLAQWDKAFERFCRAVFKPTSKRKPPTVEGKYPAIARWVRGVGWIEIGDQEGFGFIVRALDYGGLVFEDRRPRTLAGALAALERALAEHLARE